ncbi:sigma-70 family RNA polymerase sigma factor [Glycomyces terrestris]|uniref:Sigma-70 family RNA polymerase sigma factor n=1 Tax=Glycomyces terrestris TaxID=2493553 RepID=A0A426UZV7_9ACTN|nr:sigma-70 family RNA polymerase sigma factor [Glycomyces terrestris]RRS00158.1 sigma-70 family RNA polymerase sigma factor [Glycomyces terrestris]
MDAAALERFEASRNRLASLAYRLLGSAADAEDVVQDAFLRWEAADRGIIEVPEAWLTTVVTNLALDRLRSAKARRERAVGDWLPEPLLDGDPMLGPQDTAVQRESVTVAVLLLLERLTPVERAVYVLREAFSHSHGEIAQILGISESASQQYARRARLHVAAERRTEVDRAAARRIVEAFVTAASSGETDRLVELLTADATGVSDGAGLMKSLMRYTGADHLARVLRGGFKPTDAKRRLAGGAPALHAAVVNHGPAMVATVDGRAVGAIILTVRDGRIAHAVSIAAPARLTRLAAQWNTTPHDEPPIAEW